MSGWCSWWFQCWKAGDSTASIKSAQNGPSSLLSPEGSSKRHVKSEAAVTVLADTASGAPESRLQGQARIAGTAQLSLGPPNQGSSGSQEVEAPLDKGLQAAHPDALSAAATAAVAAAAAFTQLHSLQPLHGELTQLTWLGSGTGGRVYSGLWRGTPVAVKIIVSRTADEVRESMREAILGRVASHPHTVQCFASFSGYITEQDITPRSPDQGHGLTPASSAAALMHLDLDVASAAGNTSTSQAVTPTAGFSNRHGAAGVAAPSIAAAAASSMRGASATGMSPASAMLAASATASPAGTGGGVPYAELLPQPAAAAWPQEHCLPEQPASNTNTPSSQTRNVLSQHQLQPLVEAVGQEAGSVASRMSHGSRDRDADGATAQHVHSTSGSMGGGVGRISADADATLHSSPSGGPRARLGRVLVQTGADASVAEAAAAATTENGIAGGAAGAGINTTAGSRSSSLRHSHLLARGAAELARLQQQIQHQQPGTLTPSQQRGGGAGAGSFGVPASSGRGGGGGSSRALRTTPFASAVLMSHSATANAGAAGAVIIGAAAQLAGAAEDAGGAGGASASALAAALTSASAFTRLSATAAMTATESTTGTQSRVASAGTGRRRSCSLARGTPAGATSASGGQASYGTLEHRSLSLVGLGSAAHAGQSRTTLTLSDLLLGLNGGHDEGGHGGHGGGGGGAGTYELWQVLAATGALPGRYCTLVVMEMCDQGTLLTKAQQQPYRAVRSAAAAGDLLALLRTALEVAQGMCHLHSLDIVHGDLKPSNVLLQSNAASLTLNGGGGRVLAGLSGGAAAAAALAAAERERDARGYTAKVADFGMASKVEGSSHRVVNAAAGENGGEVPILGAAAKERGWGSLAYLAPEVPEYGPTKRSDVWSFGMCLYFMCCGKAPYWHYTSLRPAQMLVGIVEGSLELDWPEDTYRLLRRLAETCCQHDPAARPPFSRIVPALQRLVRHICSHPEPSTASSASAATSGAAGAGGTPGASAAAVAVAGGRQHDHSPGTGGGSIAKGAAIGVSSGLVNLRQGQGQGHRQPRSPRAATMNSNSGAYSGALDHGSSGIVNQELHPSPLQLFAKCLTLPAAGSALSLTPSAPAFGPAAGGSAIPTLVASSGGPAAPGLVGMGGAAVAVPDGAARGGDGDGGRAAGGSPAAATAAPAAGPAQSHAAHGNPYGRSAAATAALAGGAIVTAPAAAAAAAAVMGARGAAAVMGARGAAAAAAAAASQSAPADCSSSHYAADCSMGGCLDDSSLTCNTAQTFADAAQVCKALDGSSYNILPPSSLPPPPTASAAAAASAAPHFDLHHHHHNSRATSHHARGLSADPSCPSASGAAGHGSAVATSSASPTVTPITGEKTSPSASSSLSTATPANCFTTVSGGNSASNAPGVNPAEGDLGATRAFGLRLQQPRQQRPQQSLAQGEAALPQERQQAAAAAAGRGATPAVRVRRSLDVEGLAMKFDAGVSEGSAEPALAASTQAAAAVTEDAAAQVKALAGGIGAVVIASPAGAGPCIAHRDAALDDGAGI